MGLAGYTPARFPQTVTGEGLVNIFHLRVGAGQASGAGNKLSLVNLLPGDIILGGNEGATYGRYTHAALYIGGGQAVQGWLTTGISLIDAGDFLSYDRACILRVRASDEMRRRAMDYALEQRGDFFHPLAFNSGERIWNCTKIIWKAYEKQGVNLDPAQDIWVTPDNMYRSPMVKVIAEDGPET